jgi:hypothetical protein
MDALSAANLYLLTSTAVYADASYLRLKNVSLSWDLPQTWIQKAHIDRCRLYLQGQNLLTWTKYNGADPENQNLAALPPLRTFTAGIQFTF